LQNKTGYCRRSVLPDILDVGSLPAISTQKYYKALNTNIIANNKIRSSQVRLIDENGQHVGIVPIQEALKLALERGYDLIQVTDNVEPPVCRLGDLGKYVYQQEKKEREIKKQQKTEHKTIKMKYNTSIHDLETKSGQVEKFLKKGYKVTVQVILKGREKAFSSLARTQLDKFLQMLEAKTPIKVDQPVEKKPNGFLTIISRK